MRASFAAIFLRTVLAMGFAIVLLYVIFARNAYYQPAAHERSKVGEQWLTKGFAVGVVWPRHDDLSFVDGVRLAWEETDKAGGPLAGKVRLRVFTEDAPGAVVAAKVASYNDIVAVMGHEFSASAIPASVEYENHGILFFTPKSSAPRLTSHGFQYVFRLTPDDSVITDVMARFALERGFSKIGVLYRRSETGESAANQFVSRAAALNLELPFFRSYLSQTPWNTQDYRPMIAGIRKSAFDALMLSDVLPDASKVLKDLAVMGVTQPILANDKLDAPDLWDLAGTPANNVYVASAVDPATDTAEYVGFRRRFLERFRSEPGYASAQGYEAFTLFLNACRLSREADPLIVATTLRTNKWKGLFGDFSFDNEGDIVGRRVSIKKMDNGVFKTVRSYKEIQD